MRRRHFEVVNASYYAYQQSAEKTEKELGGRPLWFVDGGEQILDEILEERTVVFFLFADASGERWLETC